MRLKLIAIVALIGGPVLAFTGYTGKKDHEKLLAEGVKVSGSIDGGETRTGRKTGKSYKFDISFTTKEGRTVAKKGLPVPKSFVETHVQNNTITNDQIEVLYLPSDPNKCEVVGVENNFQTMMYGGGVAGLAGLAGLGIMLSRGRK